MPFRSVRHLFLAFFASSALLSFFPIAASAQCTLTSPSTWINGGNGDWSVAGNWNPNAVPNSSSTNVCITNGTSTVTQSDGPTVASLQLGGGNVLNITGGTFNVYGPQILNSGTISAAGNLEFFGNTALSGTGTLSLVGNIVYESGNQTLTNSSTISGYGQVGYNGLTVNNQSGGIVNANSSGNTLLFNSFANDSNTGLMEGTGGGTLELADVTLNNSGGNLTANGGTVYLASATIQGGTLNSTATGTLEGYGSVLDGVTQGTLTISSGSTFAEIGSNDIQGTINNNGTLSVGAQNLTLTGNTTLSGAGTVSMTGGTIYQSTTGLTLTNSTGNLIEGFGQIGYNGLTLVNQSGATVSANSSGNVLLLASGTFTNNGLMQATSGGTLNISGVTVNNFGGNITANGGTVELSNAIIEGGTLNSLNAGTLEGYGTLDGITQGALTISSGTTYTETGTNNIQGTINNNGTINVGANNLVLAASTTLSGTGTISIAGGTLYGPGQTLTNSTGNLIEGYGQIGYDGLIVVNQSGATISANSSGNVLLLASGTFTNNSVMQATSGGTLEISGVAVNNSGGTITANGGTVDLSGATIEGGTLSAVNAGTMEGTGTLDGITQGTLTISSGTTYAATGTNYIQGTINNNGTISVGANNLILAANATMSGTGTISMAGATLFGAGLTLTNSTGNLIEGFGQIGYNGLILVNQSGATISANSSGNTLSLASGTFTNGGLMQATNGGILAIDAIVANSGGNITANGGTVNLNGGTIQGGTLNSINGGTLNGSSDLLDGSTAQGAITISTGSVYTNTGTTNINGTIVNNGGINVGSGDFVLYGNSTLSGTGTTTLSGAAVYQSGSSITLNNGQTIQGYGQIGYNGLAVNNLTGGTINANSNGNTLTMNGTTVSNAGLLEASGGGKLAVTATLTDFSLGTLTGNYTVDGSAGLTSTLQINTLGSGGGEVKVLGDGTTPSSITLNGLNAKTLFVDSTGDNALALATISGNATLNVEGGYNMSTPGPLTTSGSVNVTGAGSTLTVNGAYTQDAGTTDIGSGATLTASSFVLAGGTTQVDGTFDPASPALIDFGTELFGNGDYVGAVMNNGEVFAGDDPASGLFTIEGDYTEGATGIYKEDLEGTQVLPDVGLLNVEGSVTLDSGAQLDIGALDFTPVFDQVFTVLDYTGSLSGTFTLEGVDANDFNVLYNPGNVQLQYDVAPVTSGTPEPASFWLVLGCLAALPARKLLRGRGMSSGD